MPHIYILWVYDNIAQLGVPRAQNKSRQRVTGN